MIRWWDHLRLKVLAFGIAMSVLPLAIFGWYGLEVARSAQVEIVQAQNQAAAQTVAEELAQFVRQITTQLALLARVEGSGLVTQPTGEQERILYTVLRDIPYLEELSLFDRSGVEILRASRREVTAGQIPRSLGDSEFWAALRRGERPLGEATIDVDGRPLFFVGVPMPDGAGALVARPTLRGLVDNIATVQAGGAIRIHVIDGSGRLIGDTDFSRVLAGHHPDLPTRDDLPYRSLTGEEAFGHLADVPGVPWRVLAETTVSDAMGPVQQLAVQFALGALFLMAVIVGLSIIFGLQLTVPLERLEAGARRVGEGDLSTRVPEGGRDELGRLVHAFNAMTDRLEAQAGKMRAERDRLDTVVSSIGAGLALIDPEGRILWVNQQLAGWFPGDLTGTYCWDSLGRTDCPGRLTACTTAEGVERSVSIGGRQRLVRYHTYVLEGAGPGEPARLEVLEDVTERRAMEQMVLQSEKLAAVGQLAAGVAHEINNPLAVISAYAEDLSDRLQDEGAASLEAGGELTGYLQQLQFQVRRCKGITTNLLDFARRGPAIPEPVDLCQVARATASLVAPRARKAGIAITVQEAEVPQVRASRDQLQQVFLNLITNAVDAMEEHGGTTIDVTAEVIDDRIRVVVRDDGPGMDAETRERAMEPFFTTKPPGKGTGLGLAMCYGIITGLGGRLWLASAPGRGTSVIFELPAWGEEEGESCAAIRC